MTTAQEIEVEPDVCEVVAKGADARDIGGFVLFAILAPAPDLRLRLLVAAAIEVVIAACGLVHFLLPGSGI